MDPPTGAGLKRTTSTPPIARRDAKIVPFAGYEMPVQYTSVMEEHLAVRKDAGLFDVSHMGLFEFTGEDVHLFLNTVAANDVALIEVGDSQYSFLLAPDGSVVDDIWVYRLERAALLDGGQRCRTTTRTGRGSSPSAMTRS